MPDLAAQYNRLETIVRCARVYLCANGDKYTGPVKPAGILSQTMHMDNHPNNGTYFHLVLSEHVPNERLSGLCDGSESHPTGIALVKLSDAYEFVGWSHEAKTLGHVTYLEAVPGGTMEGVCAEHSGRNFTWQIIYKPGREEHKPHRSQSTAEVFDPDEYRKGDWKTAVEKQLTHYERLGLDAHQHITAAEVAAAHRARANWWRQRAAQAHGGKNNPLIAELVPFIKTAEENLQQALAVLSDVDGKRAYDRQLEQEGARAVEDKFREFVDFTLRDKVLTSTEKNDLLDQARDLGIRRERAEELIQKALRETGSMEGQASSVPVVARPEVSVPVNGTDNPQLVVSQTSFSLGVLSRGDRRHCTFNVDNRGGGVLAGSIHSSHPEWLIVSQPELDPRRHHQEIGFTVDTSKLDLGLHYVGAIALNSNGGRESVRVECSIELQSALLSRWRKQVFWGGIPLGAILGLVIHHLMPSPLAYAVTQIAGLVGAIALVVVCAMAGKWGGGIGGFFLASLVQTIFVHTTMAGYSAAAWAEISSAFLFFWAKPLLTARLAGNARMKLWAAASGILVAVLIISAGFAIKQNIPRPLNLKSATLPVEDKLTGSTIGAATGIRWTNAIDNRGAVFSAASSSRIEYPGLIPPEGTLEFWIKVNSGYHYENFQFKPDQDDAMIFSSDVQGGDVTWPGTTKVFVSRNGNVSLWMATVKGPNHNPATEARKTTFRFGEWHAIGVSYGSQGQSIMLDGRMVASSPRRTQTFGVAGNQQSPLDIPTVGETVSHFWQNHRYEGGFEGILSAFRVSGKQADWMLAKGITAQISGPQEIPPSQGVPNDSGQPNAEQPPLNTSPSGVETSNAGEPRVESVSAVMSKQTQTITLTGSGFGTHEPYTGDSDYIRISDLTKRWNAGWSKDPGSDKVTLIVSSWTDTSIVISGFDGAYGAWGNSVSAGDTISFQLWNAQTGLGPATYSIVASKNAETPSSTESAITEMVSHWAAAHAANDVEATASSYAATVDPYFNLHNVTREFILQDRQSLLNKGLRLSQYQVVNVVVTMNGDKDATVNFEKLWSTRSGDSTPTRTRSQLHVHDFDGRWLIVGERDF